MSDRAPARTDRPAPGTLRPDAPHLRARPTTHRDRPSSVRPSDRVGRSITVSISTPGDCGPSDGMRGEAVIVPTVRAAIALLMIPMILIYAVLAGVAFPGAWVVTALWPAGGRPMRVRLAT